MSALDDTLVPLAKSLIERFGKSAVLEEHVDPLDYDPEIGGVTVSFDDTQSHPVKVSPPVPKRRAFKSGDNLLETDMVVYLAAKDAPVVPKEHMVCTIDGGQNRVVQVDTYYSGDQIALYGLWLRR